MATKAFDLGFHPCALIPSPEKSDGPMFCVWETIAGTTASEMRAFLGSDCFPSLTVMTTVCHPIEENPACAPYPVSKLRGEKTAFIPKARDMNSKFFVLH